MSHLNGYVEAVKNSGPSKCIWIHSVKLMFTRWTSLKINSFSLFEVVLIDAGVQIE